MRELIYHFVRMHHIYLSFVLGQGPFCDLQDQYGRYECNLGKVILHLLYLSTKNHCKSQNLIAEPDIGKINDFHHTQIPHLLYFPCR